VSAPEIEALVITALRGALPASRQPTSDAELVATSVTTVTVQPDRLAIELTGQDEPIELPWSHTRNTRRREIILPPGSAPTLRPMKVEHRARILTAIATGRSWLDELVAGRAGTTEAIADREGCSERSVRMTLSLAHLSPAIVRAIVDGRSRAASASETLPTCQRPGPISTAPSVSEPTFVDLEARQLC